MDQAALESATIRAAFPLLIAGILRSLCAPLAASSPAEQLQSKPSPSKLTADQTQAPGTAKPPATQGSPDVAPADRTQADDLDAIFREFAAARESYMKTVREALKAKKAIPPANPDDNFVARFARRVLEVATKEPRTATAEKALIRLVSTPGINVRPEAETALTILARDHASSDGLKAIVYPQSVLFWHSSAAEALLRRLIASSPSLEIRGRATFQLAELLDNRAQNVRRWQLIGKSDPVYAGSAAIALEVRDRLMKSDPKKLEDEAARLYQRVIADFATVNVDMGDGKFPQTPLAFVARIPLRALERFSAGKIAPEIKGSDLDGKAMKLSDYRGRVVVLYLRGQLNLGLIPPDQIPRQTVARFRRLSESTAGKPVAILGVVSSQHEEYKKALADQHVPMRFLWDPENHNGFSRIRLAWLAIGEDIHYVLDRDGVIRYKLGSIGAELEKAVSVLLDEMAARDRSQKPN